MTPKTPQELSAELRSGAQLPLCPYDQRSPDYWTTDNDAPCKVCGERNDPDAPTMCRGADTSLFSKAADLLDTQRAEIDRLTALVADCEVGLTWNSSSFQCLQHIRHLIDDFRAASEARSLTLDVQTPSKTENDHG